MVEPCAVKVILKLPKLILSEATYTCEEFVGDLCTDGTGDAGGDIPASPAFAARAAPAAASNDAIDDEVKVSSCEPEVRPKKLMSSPGLKIAASVCKVSVVAPSDAKLLRRPFPANENPSVALATPKLIDTCPVITIINALF